MGQTTKGILLNLLHLGFVNDGGPNDDTFKVMSKNKKK